MSSGRFQRSDRIGGDRTGEVWEATDAETGQRCAIKYVDPLVFPTPMVQQRALRELKKLEGVDSPHIVRHIAHGFEGQGDSAQLWVATDYVPGARSLARAVAEWGPMPVPRASAMVVAIGRGLGEAARVGVMHRDLSPKNVLMNEGGAVALINFCLPVPGGEVPGEPEFLAPELFEGKPVDQRTNIYSLGCLYYFLLTGRPPFTGDQASVRRPHLQGGPRPPSELAQLPPRIDQLIAKALERQSSRRFMTLRQLLTEVEGAAGDGADAGSTQPMGAAGKQHREQLGKTMMGVAPVREDEAPSDEPAGASGKSSRRRPAAKTMLGGFAALDPPSTPARGADEAVPEEGDAAPTTQMPAAELPQEPPAPATGEAPPQQQEASQAPEGGAPPQPQQSWQPPASDAPQQPPPSEQTASAEGEAAPQQPEPIPSPEPQAPRVSQPDVAQSGVGGKGKAGAGQPGRKKGGFRETLWFKKGDLDAVAAEEAARAAQQGRVVSDKADEIPIEDRYTDDGSVSAGDQHRYSLKTGHTQQNIPAVRASSRSDVSEDDLISEMKRGRGRIIIAAIAMVVVVAGIITWLATSGGDEGDSEGDEAAPTEPGAGDDPAEAPATD